MTPDEALKIAEDNLRSFVIEDGDEWDEPANVIARLRPFVEAAMAYASWRFYRVSKGDTPPPYNAKAADAFEAEWRALVVEPVETEKETG